MYEKCSNNREIDKNLITEWYDKKITSKINIESLAAVRQELHPYL